LALLVDHQEKNPSLQTASGRGPIASVAVDAILLRGAIDNVDGPALILWGHNPSSAFIIARRGLHNGDGLFCSGRIARVII